MSFPITLQIDCQIQNKIKPEKEKSPLLTSTTTIIDIATRRARLDFHITTTSLRTDGIATLLILLPLFIHRILRDTQHTAETDPEPQNFLVPNLVATKPNDCRYIDALTCRSSSLDKSWSFVVFILRVGRVEGIYNLRKEYRPFPWYNTKSAIIYVHRRDDATNWIPPFRGRPTGEPRCPEHMWYLLYLQKTASDCQKRQLPPYC
jgi:hypothetical protein